MKFTILVLCTPWLSTTSSFAQELLKVLGSPNEEIGGKCTLAGDVDGDGVQDFVLSFSPVPGPFDGIARVHSGATGSVLWEFGEPDSDGYAISAMGIGDLNHDGFDDVAVGAFAADHAGRNTGRVWVYSGLDGSILLTIDGPHLDGYFGLGLERLGDLDGDGVRDFGVSSHSLGIFAQNAGAWFAYSGATGAELWRRYGSMVNEGIVNTFKDAGDVNGDGRADVVMRMGQLMGGSIDTFIRVLSGVDGSVLYEIHIPNVTGIEGFVGVSGAGDVNNDGFGDIVAGRFNSGSSTSDAVVYSGLDSSVLHTFESYANDLSFGGEVRGVGDLDGDGHDDVALGARESSIRHDQSGYVRVHSGADGRLLRLWHGATADSLFGARIESLGDVNFDGTPDLMIGALRDNEGGLRAGSVTYMSGDLGGVSGPTGFCYGAGSAAVCPCGNTSPDGGCLNGTGRGAVLVATGSTSITDDALPFTLLNGPANSFAMIVMGDSPAAMPLGDGVLCIGGAIQRGAVRSIGSQGALFWEPGLLGSFNMANIQESFFQVWYRDSVGPCGQGANLSNGVRVIWRP